MPSSVIVRCDYDAEARALTVQFVSGRAYRYADVSSDVVARLRAAASKGAFFNAHIRDRFAYRLLSRVA